nr:PREDICTED: uncharacterized protein LOC109036751 [Bemisia tabaci]
MSRPYCFVPQCCNTKISTPEKLFFRLPNGPIRDKWCKIVRRDKVSQTSKLWCCGDHFILEEDVEDWTRFNILNAAGKDNFRLKLKKGVVPHIFDCQPDRVQAHSQELRSAFRKRQILSELKDVNWDTNARKNLEPISSHESQAELVRASDDIPASKLPAVAQAMATQTDGGVLEENLWSINEVAAPELPPADPVSSPTPLEHSQLSSGSSFMSSSFNHSVLADAACQVRPHFRSKCIQIQPKTEDKKVQTMGSCMCFSNVQNEEMEISFEEDQDVESQLNKSSGSIFSLNSSALDAGCADEDTSEDDEMALNYLKASYCDSTLSIMELQPRLFFGIDPVNMSIISFLQNYGKLSKSEIYISLRKIRLKEPNSLLSLYFNLSPSSISRSINKAMPIMAAFLKSFIFWPNRELIQKNVPPAFFSKYSKVESIIDCFEIQIQKPSDAEKQAATWSSYKDCNTVKYLISMTPDGLVNFVSRGYTGRVSDLAIVRKSGFMDVLREGTVVMTDRGFKEVEAELRKKKCILVRPPSVAKDTKHTEEEVKLTKSVASLRIHIERAIRRVREYKFLEPHSTINHNSLGIINHAVNIGCALVNLQGPLIR